MKVNEILVCCHGRQDVEYKLHSLMRNKINATIMRRPLIITEKVGKKTNKYYLVDIDNDAKVKMMMGSRFDEIIGCGLPSYISSRILKEPEEK